MRRRALKLLLSLFGYVYLPLTYVFFSDGLARAVPFWPLRALLYAPVLVLAWGGIKDLRATLDDDAPDVVITLDNEADTWYIDLVGGVAKQERKRRPRWTRFLRRRSPSRTPSSAESKTG